MLGYRQMAYCCKYYNEHSDLIKCNEFFQGVRKVSFPKRTMVHAVRKLKIFRSSYFVVSAARNLRIDISNKPCTIQIYLKCSRSTGQFDVPTTDCTYTRKELNIFEYMQYHRLSQLLFVGFFRGFTEYNG